MSAPSETQRFVRKRAFTQEADNRGGIFNAIIPSKALGTENDQCQIPAGVSPYFGMWIGNLLTSISQTAPKGLVDLKGRMTNEGGVIRVPTPYAQFGTDTGEDSYIKFDDVDDYHNSNLGLIVFNNEYTDADVGDYVDINITMNTKVNYTEDRISTGNITPLGGTPIINLNNNINNTPIVTPTNIKFITVTLTSNSGMTELEKNIIMKAFSCNIGTTLPEDGGELN